PHLTPDFYPLSLHDALPIWLSVGICRGNHREIFATILCARRNDRPARLSSDLAHLPLAFGRNADRRVNLSPPEPAIQFLDDPLEDRKSTRLNSSHVSISYAV